ncbi:MAG TPA: hypothetical protein VMX16_05925 [Terriglobia bacterium]|nr:hypothetical protein [Terriglobia bacterium]
MPTLPSYGPGMAASSRLCQDPIDRGYPARGSDHGDDSRRSHGAVAAPAQYNQDGVDGNGFAFRCHTPFIVTPTKAGGHVATGKNWIRACAGMTWVAQT